MNYKSKLKGWAVDRVTELWKITQPKFEDTESALKVLKLASDDLSAYAYVPREDLESTAADLFEMVRNAPPNESSIAALIGTLEHIQTERIQQGIDQAKTEEATH